MSATPVVLHQFPYSHYNEKARWALDWKGIPHRRVSHLPGPHAVAVRRLSGQTQTPVLELEGTCIAGSARILDALERRFPDPPLYPGDPDQRARALALQRELDDEVGPAVRTVVFSLLVREPAYLCHTFCRERPFWVRVAYRAGFPVVRRVMARVNGVTDPQGVRRAFARVERALDFVEKETGGHRPLVGDDFGVADLACAALLAPLVALDHPDMARPEPAPASLRALEARWADHPGVAWVRDRYARHRPPSCATA